METMNEEEAALLRDRLITSTMKMNKAHRNIMNGKISPMEMCTLEMLDRVRREYPDRKGVKVSEIAKKLKISMPQVSRMLNTMEKKEYILRVMDPDDRRNVYVSITDKGIEQRNSIRDNLNDCLNTIIINMGAEKIEMLSEIITEMSEIIEREFGNELGKKSGKGKETKQ